MPVEFIKCEETCYEPNAKEIHDNHILILMEKFKDSSCSCHPNATWRIAVDLNKDCKIKIHLSNKTNNPECDFGKNLVWNVIPEFLKGI